jgi:pilus assembly protein CpaF
VDVEVVIASNTTGDVRREELRVTGPFAVGRDARCELCLPSDLVSRRHVVLDVRGDSVVVEDVSTNGTYAANILLHKQRAQVAHGAPIVLGDFTLYVRPADAARAAQAIAPPASPPPMLGVPPAPPPPMPAAPPAAARAPAPNALLAATMHAPPPGPGAPALARPPVPPAPPPPTSLPGVRAPIAVPPPRPSQGGAMLPPGAEPAAPSAEASDADAALRRSIHTKLLEHLDLATMDASKLDDPSMRPKVVVALRRIVDSLRDKLPPGADRDALVGELADEALGLGPLERFLADTNVTEIMVVDAHTIYVEAGGKIHKTTARFTDDERVRAVVERIVTPLGRRIDESSPIVDARLRDGSRVNAVIRPIALKGTAITIRKFARTPLTIEKLVGYGSLTVPIARFLTRCVAAKKNVVISGGTGSGKTTLLNVLAGAIPPDERIVTIEDAAELQLTQPHVVSLETRPANMEGKGEYTIRDLVKNALRMRPDRIVVGECRGGEALDMLQAMNTGHDGSLTTTHANSPEEAVARLETLCLMAGVELPSRAIRTQIAQSVHVVVQQSRFSDGSRRITEVSEVAGIGDDGEVELRPIFEFVRTGTSDAGGVRGEFRASGYLPSFLDEFLVKGLVRPGEPYL